MRRADYFYSILIHHARPSLPRREQCLKHYCARGTFNLQTAADPWHHLATCPTIEHTRSKAEPLWNHHLPPPPPRNHSTTRWRCWTKVTPPAALLPTRRWGAEVKQLTELRAQCWLSSLLSNENLCTNWGREDTHWNALVTERIEYWVCSLTKTCCGTVCAVPCAAHL